MAVSTSPYVQNDYQSANTFRPYQLPVNDIFKSLVAQNQYWDQGALKVKNRYQDARGLNLVTDDNKKRRDDFMKNAESQLVKLNSMNLGDPSVQRQGLNLLKPLFDDNNIAGEDMTVKTLDTEYSKALRSRDDKGGKTYNPASMQNILFEKSLLTSALNRADGWQKLGQVSRYTPYVDISGELKNIMSIAKERGIVDWSESGNPYTLIKTTKSGVDKIRLQNLLDEMGSPQLKEQLRVEARNNYYSQLTANPENVDNYYQGLASNFYDTHINDLKIVEAKLSYAKSRATDPSEISTYEESLKNLTGKITKANTDKAQYIQTLSGLSDVNNLAKNRELVENLGLATGIQKISDNLAYEDIDIDYQENKALIAEQNYQIALENLKIAREKNEREKKQLENPFQGTGVVPEARPQDAALESNDQRVKAAKDYLFNKDDIELKKATISTLLSPAALDRLSEKEMDTRTIGDNHALIDEEVDELAKFAFNFTNKMVADGKMQPSSINLTVEDYKNAFKKKTVPQLYSDLSRMMLANPDFTSDVVTDIYGKPKGQETAAVLQRHINDAQKHRLNIHTQVLRDTPTYLGELSRYFTDGGKTLISDEEIEKAWVRYKADILPPKELSEGRQVVYTYSEEKDPYFNSKYPKVRQLHEKQPNEKFISVTDVLDLQKSGKGANVRTYVNTTSYIDSFKDDFKKTIDNKMRDLYLSIGARRANTAMETFQFGPGKGDDAQSNRILQMATIDANYIRETEGKYKGSEDFVDFLKSNQKDVVSYTIHSPGIDETYPYLTFAINETKDNKDAVNEYKNFKLYVQPDGKFIDTKWMSKQGNLKHVAFPGAVIAIQDLPKLGTQVKVVNMGSENNIMPKIFLSNKIINPAANDEENQYFTEAQIEAMIISNYPGTSSLKEVVERYYDDNIANFNSVFADKMLKLQNSITEYIKKKNAKSN